MAGAGSEQKVEELYRTLDSTQSDSAVSVILKLRGETCDIDCLYCYEKRKEVPGGARIGVEHIERLSSIFRDRPLAIELHGGEPLTIGKQQMRSILTALTAQSNVRRVSMQTNGVLIDDEWLDIFDEIVPGLHIGVSLDGDAEGNSWRVGYDAKPTYPRVVTALELLGRRGRRVGIISAVTPKILGRAAAVLDHLASFEAVNAASFVPAFDSGVVKPTLNPGGRTPASRDLQRVAITPADGPTWAITPDEYAEFVLAIAARWVHAGHFRRMKLEPVVSTIRRLRGLTTSFCHFSDLKCDHVFTLYPDGRLGGCDELPWPAAQLIPLRDARDESSVVNAQRSSRLREDGRSLMAKCVSCSYKTTCGGGCIATRLRAIDDDAYCRYRMRLVDGIAGLLAAPTRPSSCSCLRWRPREPNSMHDVAGFMRRWDDPATSREPVRLLRSAYGNINTVGAAGVHEADDLDPTHPQWRDGIEPGAWSLVDACTRGWNCITYDSCEGHAYEGLNTAPTRRRVGILPRDEAEYAVVAAALCRVARTASATMPASVSVLVGRADLTCELTGRRTPVLDLSLEPSPEQSWRTYFADLDDATKTLVSALDRHRPTGETTCGCGVVPASAKTDGSP
jgi:uncharacterized protein